MFVGWDWAERTHDVTVLDAAGSVVARWALAHSEEGIDASIRRLLDLRDGAEMPVAIETTCSVVVDRLRKKWMTAARLVPRPVIHRAQQPTEIAIVSIGSGDGAVHEAQLRLRANGIHADYMRIRAFPFNDEVDQFLQSHKINFVVEQNRDAQLRSMLIMETSVLKTRLRSILHYNGMPIPASYVFDGVMSVIEPQRPIAQRVV